ncbi:unnamed protein product [Rotaria sp. Silwood2]|nr:unnamed protein product [Rotaria sp. Silwood2]
MYACNISLKNALRTIRHAEFRISSCNVGYDESVHIGKYLVPLLSTYMPHLQTLCLWRPDDFPWTSIKPLVQYFLNVSSRQRPIGL